MQRTDFFKALGAIIISPLAVKGLLKDNGCQTQANNIPVYEVSFKEKTGGIWDYLVDKGRNGNINVSNIESRVVKIGDVVIIDDQYFTITGDNYPKCDMAKLQSVDGKFYTYADKSLLQEKMAGFSLSGGNNNLIIL